MDSIWVHRNCGLEIESELGYSDADNDYYFPVCPVHGSVDIRDTEAIERSTQADYLNKVQQSQQT
jgi:hypothetical protein